MTRRNHSPAGGSVIGTEARTRQQARAVECGRRDGCFHGLAQLDHAELGKASRVALARLYRGEWIGAGDPFPYILSGWLAAPGEKPFQSTLVKADRVVVADPQGSGKAMIIR